ncbi:glycosyltransferase involved in cell wall biosynthesis [Flavobacterium arsenatis]|uniref:Glycosyltransferase involved in cell wall biosynthesis n=1 Tax=Flavobacterium arsenatis TaxID=1484332 RepID=A0ABU1TLU2_9FLAO|nr:glycosyltransferase family 4 protein [Flavobacterium arsenatis]MDR6966843.1 glycosyltransferase involved in cell wall biosynthesis [Flavobacterium arsenatis]
MKNKLQILFIGFVWPEPKSSAAGLRIVQLIELFLEQGHRVTFSSVALDSDYMADLLSIGADVQRIELNSDTFDVFLKEINPEIVLFDRFMIEEQFGWRVALNCPDALRILDTEDLHSLRISRQNAFKQNKVFELDDLLKEDIAKREIASVLRCDITLVISEFEQDILKSFFKIDDSLLFYLPIFVNSNDDEVNNWKVFEERKDFMFIGNFLHEPNWNTVQYLKEEIWPLIREMMPEASLEIYGAYPSQKIFRLHSDKEGFLIKGRAKDASEVFKTARIFLAPIRFGAGIKGKLLEAMQFGTPSITTSIGAESMNGNLDWNGYITDDANTFAEKAVALYNDKQLWEKARKNGIEIIINRYKRELFVNDFIEHIVKVREGLFNHRKQNFLGALLQHHTLRSTEYMSRWIQEKNKVN